MDRRNSNPAALSSLLQLPVTLLYDYQSTNAIVDYISNAVAESAAGAAAPGGARAAGQPASAGSDSEAEEGERRPRGGGRVPSGALAGQSPVLLCAALSRAGRKGTLGTTLPPPPPHPILAPLPQRLLRRGGQATCSKLCARRLPSARSSWRPQAWPTRSLPTFRSRSSSRQEAPAGTCTILPWLCACCACLLALAATQRSSCALPPRAQWSTQPIYVLDKDNDLNVAQLAAQNAADIVKVQPEGPYLLGGHSYGGAVAMEIAMVLEGWGHEVGLVLVSSSCCADGSEPGCAEHARAAPPPPCRPASHPPCFPPCPLQIMDTPRSDQIRTAQPAALEASDEDTLELMEMILGALGAWGQASASRASAEPWSLMRSKQLKPACFGTRTLQAATPWAWAPPSPTPARATSGRP